MSDIIKIDFTTPTALNMDDRVSLRDIHNKLIEKGGTVTPFDKWVKRKLEHYIENIDYFCDRQKCPTQRSNGQHGITTTIEYYTTIQVAMEILANGHGQVGHEMRQFMSGCVRKVVESKTDTTVTLGILNQIAQAMAKVTTSVVDINNKADAALTAARAAGELAKSCYDRLEAKVAEAVSATNDLVSSKVLLDLFGDRLRHRVDNYFKGTTHRSDFPFTAKVSLFLKESGVNYHAERGKVTRFNFKEVEKWLVDEEKLERSKKRGATFLRR